MVKVIALIFSLTLSFQIFAAGSGSTPKPKNTAETAYNKGVELMLDKDFEKAERQFRKALSKKSNWAEAHNNLAYTLRKQGGSKYDEALSHYNKAIALSPKLPQPYMYRGVLHVQMGNKNLAEQDLNTLQKLDTTLAKELEFVINEGREKQPEQFFGVSPRK